MVDENKMSSMSIEQKLKQELENLVDYFSILIKTFSVVSDDISVHLAEMPSKTKEGLTEVKFSWWTLPELNDTFHNFLAAKGKLKLLTQLFQVPGLDDYLKELQNFQHHFLEFLRPWDMVEWRCFYQISQGAISWHDNRKAFIREIPVQEDADAISILEPHVQQRFREVFLRKLQTTSQALSIKAGSLVEIISFKQILEQLEFKVTESLVGGIRSQWTEIINIPEPTPVHLTILAFLVRLSVEISIRNHFSSYISPLSPRMLGKIFGILQKDPGIFVQEKSTIGSLLDSLNKVVHGKITNITKTEIIAIKEKFETILLHQKVKLPI